MPIARLACSISVAVICGSCDGGPKPTEFRVLTYNVAGLPEGLSRSDPVRFMPLISPLLNAYDLVLVQEDFAYHDALSSQVTLAYRSPPEPPTDDRPENDGLNRFSNLPFDALTRIPWDTCHGVLEAGSDCLANKGFSMARHRLPSGRTLDVYNLHADAGRGTGDAEARREQFDELATFILEHSTGRAVLVAGDTNLHGSDPLDEPVLDMFMQRTGLEDACRALSCGQEHIDRVLTRSNEHVQLQPLAWGVAEEFVDGDGHPLSDHSAIWVHIVAH